MVSGEEDFDGRLLRLEARVTRLQELLVERSRILRYLAKELCDEDLITFSRACCGLPPLPRAGFGLRGWRETTTLSSADVGRTMQELWRTITTPLEDPGPLLSAERGEPFADPRT